MEELLSDADFFVHNFIRNLSYIINPQTNSNIC